MRLRSHTAQNIKKIKTGKGIIKAIKNYCSEQEVKRKTWTRNRGIILKHHHYFHTSISSISMLGCVPSLPVCACVCVGNIAAPRLYLTHIDRER